MYVCVIICIDITVQQKLYVFWECENWFSEPYVRRSVRVLKTLAKAKTVDHDQARILPTWRIMGLGTYGYKYLNWVLSTYKYSYAINNPITTSHGSLTRRVQGTRLRSPEHPPPSNSSRLRILQCRFGLSSLKLWVWLARTALCLFGLRSCGFGFMTGA